MVSYLAGVQSVLRDAGNLLHDGAKSRLCSVRDERDRLHGDLADSEPLGCGRNTEARKALGMRPTAGVSH